MKQIDFYYFSGTGNTQLVVDEMSRFFQDNKVEVIKQRMEKSRAAEVNLDSVIGLAFPVACFSTYKFVWRWFESLPETTSSTKIFMVDTMAAFSGGMVGPLRTLLRKKGYDTIGAKEIIMPSNYSDKRTKRKKDRVVEKGVLEARKYAHDILFGVSKWNASATPNPIQYIGKSEKVWDFMRNRYDLEMNETLCIKCGICYKLCPVYNISMEHFPEFGDRCELCMRCVAFCPTQAIDIKNMKYKHYQAVKAEEMMK